MSEYNERSIGFKNPQRTPKTFQSFINFCRHHKMNDFFITIKKGFKTHSKIKSAANRIKISQ
jgi:hypothetical protein